MGGLLAKAVRYVQEGVECILDPIPGAPFVK